MRFFRRLVSVYNGDFFFLGISVHRFCSLYKNNEQNYIIIAMLLEENMGLSQLKDKTT